MHFQSADVNPHVAGIDKDVKKQREKHDWANTGEL